MWKTSGERNIDPGTVLGHLGPSVRDLGVNPAAWVPLSTPLGHPCADTLEAWDGTLQESVTAQKCPF